MRKKIISIAVSVLITVLFLRTAMSLPNFDFLEYASDFNVRIFSLGVVCYVLTYLFRAYRIHRLEANGKSFFITLSVCFKHQFFGRILPFKTGDLSLVYLLGRHCGSTADSAGGTLLAIRFFDGAVMLTSFLICAVITVRKTASHIIAASAAILIVLFAAPFIAKRIVLLLEKHFKNSKIIGFCKKICNSLSSLSKNDLLATLISTVALWVFIYLSMHFTALSFGIDITFPRTVTASFLASAAALLPVNGLGGFGVTETGWTAGFIMMGAKRGAALASGIASNLMSFCVICIFGAVSFFTGRKKNV